jgi:20S proteasome alpha/beta subunit
MYIRAKCRLLLRLELLCMISTIITVICRVDTSVGNQLMAPIQNFEPSWTASSAGGTTIAIPFTLKDVACANQKHDSCSEAVLLIFRSSVPLAISSSTDGARNYQRTERLTSALALGGLRIVGPMYSNSDAIPLSRSAQRWTLLGSGTICSMTGFAPDIDYLTRYVQNFIDNHRTTYESTCFSKTASVSPIKLVELLAEELQEAGQWQGGRPFGVQILMVGPDPTLGIFTLDPGGGHRRWRGAAAIGRNGKIIRDRLFEHWISQSSTEEFPDDGVEALSSGLHASVLSRMEESEKLERSDTYEAMLVWQVKSEVCAAQIDRAQIDDIRKSILEKNKLKPIKNG